MRGYYPGPLSLPVSFYLAFTLSVTASAQLVGLYLVFASLIVPALAVRRIGKGALPAAYLVGVMGHGVGLAVSTLPDLPSPPVRSPQHWSCSPPGYGRSGC